MEQDEKYVEVPCVKCQGKPIVLPEICPGCDGKGKRVVFESAPAFKVTVGNPDGTERLIMAVTWAGDVVYGPPMSKEELADLARKTSAPMVMGMLVLASEVAKFKRQVSDLRAYLNAP